MKNFVWLISISAIFLFGCKKNKEEDPDETETFDKSELLTNYADNIIIPAYSAYKIKVDSLEIVVADFLTNKTVSNLTKVKEKFIGAYISYQSVSTFEFGPAESVYHRTSCNTFPCDTAQIKTNIQSGTYDLNAANNIDAKAYPALDYLLFGNGKTEQQIVDDFSIDVNATSRCNYLTTIVSELKTKATSIVSQWNSSYRASFISSNGSDIGSSIGLLVNQLNQDFEITKNYRVGIPLGKKTLGIILPEKCEAYYSKKSLTLLKKQIESVEKIYSGNGGKGFDDYLSHLNAEYNGGSLNTTITNQFVVVKQKIDLIPETLDNSIINNSAPVEAAYTELQRLVVLLKADMPSALGIVITYQDTDGD